MITIKQMDSYIAMGSLTMSFVGLPYKNTGRPCIYNYKNQSFTRVGNRVGCPTMICKTAYTRHISKIIMVLHGDKLLYGRRCRQCGSAVPKSHGNCFGCYSERIEHASFGLGK